MRQDSIAAVKGAAEGKKFLEENKTKEGVVTLPNGLQYKVITEGSGPSPKETDKVMVNYRGTLVNGQEFDASHGQPATFQVNQVIPGWTQALKMMKKCAKWMLYVPPELAYGPGGRPGIPPNAVLIFEVELVDIK